MPRIDLGHPWGKVEISEEHFVPNPVQVSCLRCGEMHQGWEQRLEQAGCLILRGPTRIAKRIQETTVTVNSVLVGLPWPKIPIMFKDQLLLRAVRSTKTKAFKKLSEDLAEFLTHLAIGDYHVAETMPFDFSPN